MRPCAPGMQRSTTDKSAPARTPIKFHSFDDAVLRAGVSSKYPRSVLVKPRKTSKTRPARQSVCLMTMSYNCESCCRDSISANMAFPRVSPVRYRFHCSLMCARIKTGAYRPDAECLVWRAPPLLPQLLKSFPSSFDFYCKMPS